MKSFLATILLLFLGICVYGQTEPIKVDTSSSKKIDSVTVYVKFSVSKDGKISNVQVKKTNCNNCDASTKKQFEAEALRAIKQSSAFNNTSGKKVWYIQPITFLIEEQ